MAGDDGGRMAEDWGIKGEVLMADVCGGIAGEGS
jgi:hypothetical protein